MDFNSKNFRYVTDSFGNIVERLQNGSSRLYLRSLSHDKPTESPANMSEDFPGLSGDFCLPEEVSFVRENLFSSVLRVSGRVNMWLHYDVSVPIPFSMARRNGG
jgi:tRNA wybutosine-synthesizing protein 4